MKGVVICGDNLKQLKKYPDNYFHAVATDSPYGLGTAPDANQVLRDWLRCGFHKVKAKGGIMNKAWDNFVPQPKFWKEVFRVLRPGGHVLSFFGTRTYDWGVMAMRIAGFEIRESLYWHHGQGFPKNKHLGPATGIKTWEGWGSALKPATEPIVLARKPLDGTLTENIKRWGTGGLNIDGCRIAFQSEADRESAFFRRGTDIMGGNFIGGDHSASDRRNIAPNEKGRYPANVLLDETAAALMDEQSGILTSGAQRPVNRSNTNGWESDMPAMTNYTAPKNSGGASRFFYVAKPSQEEKNAGLERFAARQVAYGNQAKAELAKGNTGFSAGSLMGMNKVHEAKNTNVSVKPIELMRYLVRMIVPPKGILLDPFGGSGTTACACELENMQYVLIEQDAYDCKVATARARHFNIIWYEKNGQTSLFNNL